MGFINQAGLLATQFIDPNEPPFKCRADGTSNDGPGLQAAIDHLGSLEGGYLMPRRGIYKYTTMLDNPYPNVRIWGHGSDGYHNTGTQGALAGTTFKWAGDDGGTMLHIRSAEGVNAQKMTGSAVSGIFFDSGATANSTGAAYGVRLSSQDRCNLDNLFFREFQTKGIKMDCVTTLFDPRDPQYNILSQCWSRNFVNQSGGLISFEGDVVTPGAGSGGTGSAANVSNNMLLACGAQFYNGVAFEFKDSDHNRLFGCAATRIAGGTGQGIVFHGSNEGTNFCARRNEFYGWTGGSEIIAKGTGDYTYASYDNEFLMIDAANNTPLPTLGTGATCWIRQRSDGSAPYPLFISGVFGPPALNTGTNSALLQEIYKRVVNESLRISNRSADGVRYERPAADYLTVDAEWAQAVDASGHMAFTRVSGSGTMKFGTHTALGAETVTGYITITDAGGTTRKLAVVS